MLRHRTRGLQCVGGAAVVVVACLPLTSCDSRSAQADSVGYVAIVSAHGVAKPIVKPAVGGTVNPAPAPQGAVPVQPPAVPIGPVPPYEVIAQRTSDRPDKATTYYVVLGSVDPAILGTAPADPVVEGPEPVQLLGEGGAPAELVADVIVPVDPASAAFKPSVKQVLRSLAAINGGPDFTAHIWDEVTAAQTEVSYKSAPDLFTDAQYASKEAANAGHLLASYQGGVQPEGQSPVYVLFWFPDGGASNPVGGSLTSSEVWRP